MAGSKKGEIKSEGEGLPGTVRKNSGSVQLEPV
jgi:hypothetical protein